LDNRQRASVEAVCIDMHQPYVNAFAEVAYGRTLPRNDADYPIRGYEYYDYLHHVVNTKFVNFQDNATRKSGAISYLPAVEVPVERR
jgi:hypothetical protein